MPAQFDLRFDSAINDLISAANAIDAILNSIGDLPLVQIHAVNGALRRLSDSGKLAIDECTKDPDKPTGIDATTGLPIGGYSNVNNILSLRYGAPVDANGNRTVQALMVAMNDIKIKSNAYNVVVLAMLQSLGSEWEKRIWTSPLTGETSAYFERRNFIPSVIADTFRSDQAIVDLRTALTNSGV